MAEVCCAWRFKKDCRLRNYLSAHFPGLQQLRPESTCNRFELTILLHCLIHSKQHMLKEASEVEKGQLPTMNLHREEFWAEARKMIMAEALGADVVDNDQCLDYITTALTPLSLAPSVETPAQTSTRPCDEESDSSTDSDSSHSEDDDGLTLEDVMQLLAIAAPYRQAYQERLEAEKLRSDVPVEQAPPVADSPDLHNVDKCAELGCQPGAHIRMYTFKLLKK
jgi:hypothetical protein